MHIGHIVPLLTLRRFQQAGHRPVLISRWGNRDDWRSIGPFEERNLLTKEQIEQNVNGLKAQMERIFDFSDDGKWCNISE